MLFHMLRYVDTLCRNIVAEPFLGPLGHEKSPGLTTRGFWCFMEGASQNSDNELLNKGKFAPSGSGEGPVRTGPSLLPDRPVRFTIRKEILHSEEGLS